MAKSLPASGPQRKRFKNPFKRKAQAHIKSAPEPISQKTISAFIDVNTDFEGRLKFGGTMHLDGRFKGEIEAVGGLIIGKKAIVKADIHASDITISGEVTGNIRADKSVEILTSGKVIGDIQAANIIVHPGAVLVGNCITSPPTPKAFEPVKKSEPKLKAKSKPSIELKAEPATASKPEIDLEPKPKPEIKLEPEPGLKPKKAPEPKPQEKKTRFRPV